MAKSKKYEGSALQKINNRAKAIKKESPNKSHTAAVKQAAAEYRAKKKG